MNHYTVTIEAYGRVSVLKVEADSPAHAESLALAKRVKTTVRLDREGER
jgi:hypothetical protein